MPINTTVYYRFKSQYVRKWAAWWRFAHTERFSSFPLWWINLEQFKQNWGYFGTKCIDTESYRTFLQWMLIRQVEQKVAWDETWLYFLFFFFFCFRSALCWVFQMTWNPSCRFLKQHPFERMEWTELIPWQKKWQSSAQTCIRSCANIKLHPCPSVCPQSEVVDVGADSASILLSGRNNLNVNMCTCKLYTFI